MSTVGDTMMSVGISRVHQRVFSTLGDIVEYREYSGGYHDECGDITSTPEGVQYTGGYHDECQGIS